MPVGTTKTEYTEHSIHNNKNTQPTELNKSTQNIQPYTYTTIKKREPKEHQYTATLRYSGSNQSSAVSNWTAS
jgi:hypothetical protein